jgi:hypothetical protein
MAMLGRTWPAAPRAAPARGARGESPVRARGADHDTPLACLLLAAFFSLELRACAVRRRAAAAVLAFAPSRRRRHGIARYDHGHPDCSRIGWVGAPVIVIFGAAAAGAPVVRLADLGPLPGRLALLRERSVGVLSARR